MHAPPRRRVAHTCSVSAGAVRLMAAEESGSRPLSEDAQPSRSASVQPSRSGVRAGKWGMTGVR
eukprot:3541635-Pleurochrysis_carterae.AAC.1